MFAEKLTTKQIEYIANKVCEKIYNGYTVYEITEDMVEYSHGGIEINLFTDKRFGRHILRLEDFNLKYLTPDFHDLDLFEKYSKKDYFKYLSTIFPNYKREYKKHIKKQGNKYIKNTFEK